MPPAVERLKRRADFLRVAAARRKWASAGLVLQVAARRGGEEEASAPLRYGLTASRKVGKAVQRNRARRRLRALAEEVLPRHASPGHDYVLIGRRTTVERPFGLLRHDLHTALRKLGVWREEAEADDAATAGTTIGTGAPAQGNEGP